MAYVVKTFETTYTPNLVVKTETYRTRNEAEYRFQCRVWDILAAFGKLDTSAAHMVMRQARARINGEINADSTVEVSNTGFRVALEESRP